MWCRRPGRPAIAEALRDRDLVRLYWPVALRPAFDALFTLEDTLLEVVATSTQPALGAIRLAWWRDALERLDHAPPPPEPRLTVCALELLSHGVSGAQLAAIADGYSTLFDEAPDLNRLRSAGAALFDCAARMVGGEDRLLKSAGGLHAMARIHRLGLLAHHPLSTPSFAAHRFPKRLRRVTGLARLAARDLRRGAHIEPEATPARAAALLAHRFTGVIA